MSEIIVEIGNTHEGSLGIATSLIDMAVNAGIKTVKFQMHIPEAEGIPDEPFRVKFSHQDENRQDYWRRVNFSLDHWKFLSSYCQNLGVEFLCTPFSVEAAKVLYQNNMVKRWKVGSGNTVDWPLIDFLTQTNLPLIISTGLVSWDEILTLQKRLVAANAWSRTTLLHCVSKYPVKLEEIDLHLMEKLSELGCKVGYSDHSGNMQVSMYAISKGAEIIEIHMTPHRNFFGPDVSSSLLPEEISQLVSYSNLNRLLSDSNRSKDTHFQEVSGLRKMFRKGVYWAEDIKEGEVVSVKHLKFLKPVDEIDVVDYEILIGRKVSQDCKVNAPVKWNEIRK